MSDEVSEILRRAYGAVETAGIPEHLQAAAFREAVNLLSPEPTQPAPISPPTPTPASVTAANGDSTPAVSEEVMYARVAEHTGADAKRLERLVHMDEDGPRITLPGLRLGATNAEKTRVVAQVLTIFRGFGLGENDTPLEAIRNEVMRLKCYDSANFSAQLAKLDGFVITGSGQSRKIRAKSDGIGSFAALVERLVGGRDE